MAESNRRTFLAGAMALGAMAAAPPTRKLGYAIVGLGSYAVNQIMPQFANARHSRLAALVSGTPEKLEKLGAQYRIPATHRYSYAQFDRIRDNPDIDAVYVILPNAMHAEYSIRAAQAGKHVMCEKPMAVSVQEAEAMVAACRKAGKLLMIGYRSQFEPHNLHAIRLIREEALGPVRQLGADHGFPIRGNQWRLDKALSGGGSLMDIGIYSLQAARYLTGEEPVALTAMESTDRSDPRFATVEDRIDWLMRFPSGSIASCVSSYSSHHNRYRATGTRGWVELEPATSYSGQAMRVHRDRKTEVITPPNASLNQFVGQLDELALALSEGRQPRASGEDGLKDMRLIEAIYRSAREGRTLELGA